MHCGYLLLIVNINQMEYTCLVTVTESSYNCPIEGVSQKSVNMIIGMVIAMMRRIMKTTGDISVHIFMIHMILYHSSNNIIFQIATIRLRSINLWWMILVRKYTLLSCNYFLLFLGIMTHLVQAKDSLGIPTTAVNIMIKQKLELQQNVPTL